MITPVRLLIEPADLLRHHGVRLTAQRLAVLRAVSARPHGTAHDVATLARAEIGSISHQAVYDTLGVLVEKGILRRIQPVGSAARYEHRADVDHHHLVCRACGVIVDVEPVVDAAASPIPPGGEDFEIDWAEVIYWGRCPTCRTADAGT
jgi:Fur family transcriptional regulator, stress-responsive regulator